MREILFRGKNLGNGEWVEGNLIHSTERFGTEYDSWFIVEVGEFFRELYCADEVDPATVGQFTGLLDMDGHRIFEGDLLKSGGKRVFLVEYNPDIACFVAHPTDEGLSYPCMNTGTMKNYRVVGNVYDNHNLMKGGTP